MMALSVVPPSPPHLTGWIKNRVKGNPNNAAILDEMSRSGVDVTFYETLNIILVPAALCVKGDKCVYFKGTLLLA